MSDTPRTDLELKNLQAFDFTGLKDGEVVFSDFARTLELELQAANEKLEKHQSAVATYLKALHVSSHCTCGREDHCSPLCERIKALDAQSKALKTLTQLQQP